MLVPIQVVAHIMDCNTIFIAVFPFNITRFTMNKRNFFLLRFRCVKCSVYRLGSCQLPVTCSSSTTTTATNMTANHNKDWVNDVPCEEFFPFAKTNKVKLKRVFLQLRECFLLWSLNVKHSNFLTCAKEITLLLSLCAQCKTK